METTDMIWYLSVWRIQRPSAARRGRGFRQNGEINAALPFMGTDSAGDCSYERERFIFAYLLFLFGRVRFPKLVNHLFHHLLL